MAGLALLLCCFWSGCAAGTGRELTQALEGLIRAFSQAGEAEMGTLEAYPSLREAYVRVQNEWAAISVSTEELLPEKARYIDDRVRFLGHTLNVIGNCAMCPVEQDRLVTSGVLEAYFETLPERIIRHFEDHARKKYSEFRLHPEMTYPAAMGEASNRAIMELLAAAATL